jgi:predicted negative regulator of RcsB-dependent stress response
MMFGAALKPWILLGALLALIAAFGWGWRSGADYAQAKHAAALLRAQNEAFRAAELASRREAERLAAEAQAADLARELEDLANADPASGTGLPLGRVLRLNRY